MIRDEKKAAMSNGARRVTTRALAHLEQRVIDGESGQANMVIEIGLDGITVDEAIQVRVAGLSDEKVRQYAVVFEEGGEFPPVIVFRDERTDELFLADGFHRVEAAKFAGLSAIKAEVRPGGRDAAIEYAEEANLEHGFALTTRDKRNIYERRWKRGHEWRNLSDGAVARVLGVTRQTISNWRRQLEEEEAATGKILPVGPRVGADGKVRDVSRIQEANRERARKSERYYAQISVGLLDALEAAGGAMEFNALIRSLDGVSAEDAERAARKLAERGGLVLVGRGEEIWAALPDEARKMEQERRRQEAQPVRYVGGDEFNQDAGDEAAYGVPVVEEEAPAQGSAEDFRALVEMYKGWITEILERGAAKYGTLMQNIVGSDGKTEQVNAFIAAIGELTRAKKVINDGGYYRMARGYTPVVPPAPQAERVDEEISDEARSSESELFGALMDLVSASEKAARLVEDLLAGKIEIGKQHGLDVYADVAHNVLLTWHGYTTDGGEQIVGLAALLVALLGELEGNGGA